MIKEIRHDLFCIEVPLPKNPLKAVNSYIIRGPDRNLVIDTAMNRAECKEVLMPGLAELGIDLQKTDFFITHLHADHFGLIGDLATDESKCYLGCDDVNYIQGGSDWNYMLQSFIDNGFPTDSVGDSMSRHPGMLYSSNRMVELTPVSDGDVIRVGDYELTCIETPGHSPGHVCLYDKNKKIFFSGDHVLFDITPNISNWKTKQDSLGDYLASLEKVSALPVEMVLPGHRSARNSLVGRVEELKQHHRNRLEEVIAALQIGDKTAYEVAPHITWKIEFREWEDFPIGQKWFAVGETLAHLQFLEHKGKVNKYHRDGLIYYTLN